MSLNQLAEEIHGISREKGFWPQNEYCKMTNMRHACHKDFCGSPGRDTGGVLMLIVTEVAEAQEELRDNPDPYAPMGYEHTWFTNGTPAGVYHFPRLGRWGVQDEKEGTSRELTHEELVEMGADAKPVGFASELADIIIRTLDMAGAYGIDIERAVREKIVYNATRPAKHGRAA